MPSLRRAARSPLTRAAARPTLLLLAALLAVFTLAVPPTGARQTLTASAIAAGRAASSATGTGVPQALNPSDIAGRTTASPITGSGALQTLNATASPVTEKPWFGRSTLPSATSVASPQASASTPAADEAQARTTCGGCHAFPPPDILPESAWRSEVVRMHYIRENRLPPTGPASAYRTVPLPPDMEQALAFYTSRAPESLAAPEAWPDPSKSPLRFERRGLTMTELPGTPAVSNLQLLDLDGDGKLDLLGTDMRQGLIFRGRPGSVDPLTPIASIPHPAHASRADVDGDGVADLLVGDLGEFFPADHAKGAVIWLRGLPDGKFGAFWLDGWPRVADVEAGDFNGDGHADLAVAAFGWRKTGQVAILEYKPGANGQPDFTRHTLDPRPGSISVAPVDLNGDGHLDLVTLLAQEHESVIAYINTGRKDFTFEPQVIYAAPHPNWGSSGFQLVDLDKDGDLDVLLTHGDTFDDGIVKPYHGIQFLENKGRYPYTEHTLATLPGVHRAVAADMDGDGDLDVVAGALLAAGSNLDESTLAALVWLEQTKPGVFARHSLEIGFPRHATLDVGDVDGDGDLDIVTGQFRVDRSTPDWVDVWVNGGKK